MNIWNGWQAMIPLLVPTIIIGVLTCVFALLLRNETPKCLHDWKVMDKHVEPGLLDKCHGHVKLDGYDASELRGHYICIMACPKCGAIDKTVEEV